MFDDDEDFEFPRKWLDKKWYTRMDQKTGVPELVRVEPHIEPDGEFIPHVVEITIDNGPVMIMGRDEAEMYVLSSGCVPMEIIGKHKHGRVH